MSPRSPVIVTRHGLEILSDSSWSYSSLVVIRKDAWWDLLMSPRKSRNSPRSFRSFFSFMNSSYASTRMKIRLESYRLENSEAEDLNSSLYVPRLVSTPGFLSLRYSVRTKSGRVSNCSSNCLSKALMTSAAFCCRLPLSKMKFIIPSCGLRRSLWKIAELWHQKMSRKWDRTRDVTSQNPLRIRSMLRSEITFARADECSARAWANPVLILISFEKPTAGFSYGISILYFEFSSFWPNPVENNFILRVPNDFKLNILRYFCQFSCIELHPSTNNNQLRVDIRRINSFLQT